MTTEISETRDDELVWQISQSDGVRDFVINDKWEEMGDEVRRNHIKIIVNNPENHVLLVLQDDSVSGCFILDFKQEKGFEIHSMMLPISRGMKAIRAGRLAIEFAFKIPGVERLFSFCPMSNRQSYFFAIFCGFHSAGNAAWSWIKNNTAYDVKIVELTKEEFHI